MARLAEFFQNRANEISRSAGEKLIKRKKWLARLKIMLSAILWKARRVGMAEIDFSDGFSVVQSNEDQRKRQIRFLRCPK